GRLDRCRHNGNVRSVDPDTIFRPRFGASAVALGRLALRPNWNCHPKPDADHTAIGDLAHDLLSAKRRGLAMTDVRTDEQHVETYFLEGPHSRAHELLFSIHVFREFI